MLKIILGRISSGKTERIINLIGERIKESKQSVLIVPDPVTYNFEQRMCSQLNVNGFIDAEVCSFNRFASNILSYCGKGRKTFSDDCMRMMMLRKCINASFDSFLLFKNASKRKGFVKRCLNMISTLENCGYSPEDILAVTETLPDGVLKYKLHDTALIYEKYMHLLSEGYTDNSDRLLSAQHAIPECDMLSDTVIFIDGFDVFTSRLLSFISALMNKCDVVIALSSSRDRSDREAYEIHENTLKKITSLAKESGIETKYEFASQKGGKSDEINFIANNFFSSNPEKFQGECKNVSLTYYRTLEDEVYSVARQITRDVRSGMRYKNIAVLCGDTNKYSPVVSSVFSRLSLPVYTDTEHDIASHPVALYIFSLFRCITAGFSPSSTEDMLLSSLTSFTRDECDRFISYMRETGITGHAIEYGCNLALNGSEKQADFEDLRQRLVTPVKELKNKLLNAKTAREMAELCYGFLKSENVYEKLNSLAEKYESAGEYSLSDVTSQLWNTACKLLEDAAAIFGESKISVSEFAAAVQEGFNASPVSTIPSVLDCITFGSLNASREQNVLVTYILGVNDGVIPAIYTDERLVTVKESEILTEKGLELAHSAGTEDARIRYSMYSAFCSPENILRISCPLTSQSGTALAPSYVFSKFTSLFPTLEVLMPSPVSPLDVLQEPFTKEELVLAVAKDKLNSQASKTLLSLFEEERDFNTVKFVSSSKNGNIHPSVAKELFSSAVSVSRLEKFAQCPLYHFLESGLRPQRIKDYTFDDLDRGDVFHSVLERFVRESNAVENRQECNRLTGKIFDEESEKIHFGAMVSTSRQRNFNKVLKNIISACAWEVKEQLTDYETLGSEVHFGYGGVPPLKVETEYGTLKLKGSIDRADKTEKDGKIYLRVVDYKSGKYNYKKENINTGTQLQITVYMNALISAVGKNAVPAEAFYMSLSENDIKCTGLFLSENSEKSSKKISAEEFENLLSNTKDTVKRLSSEMLSGNIEAHTDCNQCNYCRFASVCGKIKKEDSDGE